MKTSLNSFSQEKKAIPEHRIPSLVVTIGCQYIKYKSLNQITQKQIGHFFLSYRSRKNLTNAQYLRKGFKLILVGAGEMELVEEWHLP